MPQYMLLIYTEEQNGQGAPDPAARQALLEEYFALSREMEERGVVRSANELEDTPAAASVRVRDGEALVTDGPFAETKETLGGYYLIECGSREEALAWAAKIPSARYGTVEVRPIIEHQRS